MHFSWTLLLLGAVCTSAYPPQDSGLPGCFDCNFAPSGYIRTSDGSGKEVGYVRCALQQREDFDRVDAPPCASGKCFIRLEDNGLEYRGCADPENLPLDVDSSLQCKYQGAGKPLWYFCDGHNCNSGQIGQDEAHCGQSSSLPVYANQVLAGSSEESSSEGSPDHGALVAHSPDALPPEQTGEEPSTQGYPYYSEYEYYGEYTETGDTGVAEETEDSDSDNRQHPKFGYYHPKSQSYKSGHETASKSYTGNSDQAFSKSQVGNSNAAFNHDVARLQFDENFQQYMKQQPEDFLRQFRFWYYLMPAYWLDYFGYSKSLPHPPIDEETHNSGKETTEYGYTEAPTEGTTVENYDTDQDDFDTSASNSLYDQHGRYNPCRGCEDNPSGLYADVTRQGHFIQCGCAMYDGAPCTCCFPFPMSCPNNTRFSSVSKTCVRFGDYPQRGW